MSLVVAESMLKELDKKPYKDTARDTDNLGGFSYNNKYDAWYNKYSKDSNFNYRLWRDAQKTEEQDKYMSFLMANEGKKLSPKFYDDRYYNYNEMMLEMYANSELVDNTNLSKRTTQKFDTTKNKWVDVDLGEMTDKQYIQYQLEQSRKITDLEIKRQEEALNKERLSNAQRAANNAKALFAEFGERAVGAIAGFFDLFIAAGQLKEQIEINHGQTDSITMTGLDGSEKTYARLDDAFIGYMGGQSLTAMEQENIRAKLLEYERLNCNFMDIDGNLTSFGKTSTAIVGSIGQMLPGIVLGAGVPGLGTAIFYSSVFSTNLYENATNVEIAGSPSIVKIGNAALKTAVEATVEVALGKILGGTIQNSLLGLKGRTSTVLTKFAAKFGGKNTSKAAMRSLAASGIAYTAKSALQEGLEEFLQDFSTNLVDQFTGMMYDGYQNTGVNFQTLVDSFAVGMLSSLFLSGGSMTLNSARTAAKNLELQRKTGAKGLANDYIVVDGKLKKVRGFAKIGLSNMLGNLNDAIETLKTEKIVGKKNLKLAQETYAALTTLADYYGALDDKRMKNVELLLSKVVEAENASRQQYEHVVETSSRAVSSLSRQTVRRPQQKKNAENLHSYAESIYKTIDHILDIPRNRIIDAHKKEIVEKVRKAIEANAEELKDSNTTAVTDVIETRKEDGNAGTNVVVESVKDRSKDAKPVNSQAQLIADKITQDQMFAKLLERYGLILTTDGHVAMANEDVLILPESWVHNYGGTEIYKFLEQENILQYMIDDFEKDHPEFLKALVEFDKKNTGRQKVPKKRALMDLLFNQEFYQSFILSDHGKFAHEMDTYIFRLHDKVRRYLDKKELSPDRQAMATQVYNEIIDTMRMPVMKALIIWNKFSLHKIGAATLLTPEDMQMLKRVRERERTRGGVLLGTSSSQCELYTRDVIDMVKKHDERETTVLVRADGTKYYRTGGVQQYFDFPIPEALKADVIDVLENGISENADLRQKFEAYMVQMVLERSDNIAHSGYDGMFTLKSAVISNGGDTAFLQLMNDKYIAFEKRYGFSPDVLINVGNYNNMELMSKLDIDRLLMDMSVFGFQYSDRLTKSLLTEDKLSDADVLAIKEFVVLQLSKMFGNKYHIQPRYVTGNRDRGTSVRGDTIEIYEVLPERQFRRVQEKDYADFVHSHTRDLRYNQGFYVDANGVEHMYDAYEQFDLREFYNDGIFERVPQLDNVSARFSEQKGLEGSYRSGGGAGPRVELSANARRIGNTLKHEALGHAISDAIGMPSGMTTQAVEKYGVHLMEDFYTNYPVAAELIVQKAFANSQVEPPTMILESKKLTPEDYKYLIEQYPCVKTGFATMIYYGWQGEMLANLTDVDIANNRNVIGYRFVASPGGHADNTGKIFSPLGKELDAFDVVFDTQESLMLSDDKNPMTFKPRPVAYRGEVLPLELAFQIGNDVITSVDDLYAAADLLIAELDRAAIANMSQEEKKSAELELMHTIKRYRASERFDKTKTEMERNTFHSELSDAYKGLEIIQGIANPGLSDTVLTELTINEIILNPQDCLSEEMLELIGDDLSEGNVYSVLTNYIENKYGNISIDRESMLHEYVLVDDNAYDDFLLEDIAKLSHNKGNEISKKLQFAIHGDTTLKPTDFYKKSELDRVLGYAQDNISIKITSGKGKTETKVAKDGKITIVIAYNNTNDMDFVNRLNHEFRHAVQYVSYLEGGFTPNFEVSKDLLHDVKERFPELMDSKEIRAWARENIPQAQITEQRIDEWIVQRFIYYSVGGELKAYGIFANLIKTKPFYVNEEMGQPTIYTSWYDAKTGKGRYATKYLASLTEDVGVDSDPEILVEKYEKVTESALRSLEGLPEEDRRKRANDYEKNYLNKLAETVKDDPALSARVKAMREKILGHEIVELEEQVLKGDRLVSREEAARIEENEKPENQFVKYLNKIDRWLEGLQGHLSKPDMDIDSVWKSFKKGLDKLLSKYPELKKSELMTRYDELPKRVEQAIRSFNYRREELFSRTGGDYTTETFVDYIHNKFKEIEHWMARAWRENKQTFATERRYKKSEKYQTELNGFLKHKLLKELEEKSPDDYKIIVALIEANKEKVAEFGSRTHIPDNKLEKELVERGELPPSDDLEEESTEFDVENIDDLGAFLRGFLDGDQESELPEGLEDFMDDEVDDRPERIVERVVVLTPKQAEVKVLLEKLEDFKQKLNEIFKPKEARVVNGRKVTSGIGLGTQASRTRSELREELENIEKELDIIRAESDSSTEPLIERAEKAVNYLRRSKTYNLGKRGFVLQEPTQGVKLKHRDRWRESKELNVESKRVYIKKSDDNLKYFTGKQMSPEFRDFIKATTGHEDNIDKPIMFAITNGKLTEKLLHEYIREVKSNEMSDYTFELLNKHLFKNDYFKSLAEVDSLMGLGASFFWAMARVMKKEGFGYKEFTTSNTVEALLDMGRLVKGPDGEYTDSPKLTENPAARKFYEAVRKEQVKFEPTSVVTEGGERKQLLETSLNSDDEGYMRILMLDQFSGSLADAYYVANLYRKTMLKILTEKIKNNVSIDATTGSNDRGDKEQSLEEKISSKDIVGNAVKEDDVGRSILAYYNYNIKANRDKMIFELLAASTESLRKKTVLFLYKKKQIEKQDVEIIYHLLNDKKKRDKLFSALKTKVQGYWEQGIKKLPDDLQEQVDFANSINDAIDLYTKLIDEKSQELKLLSDDELLARYSEYSAADKTDVEPDLPDSGSQKNYVNNRKAVVARIKNNARYLLKTIQSGEFAFSKLPDDVKKLFVVETVPINKRKATVYMLNPDAYSVGRGRNKLKGPDSTGVGREYVTKTNLNESQDYKHDISRIVANDELLRDTVNIVKESIRLSKKGETINVARVLKKAQETKDKVEKLYGEIFGAMKNMKKTEIVVRKPADETNKNTENDKYREPKMRRVDDNGKKVQDRNFPRTVYEILSKNPMPKFLKHVLTSFMSEEISTKVQYASKDESGKVYEKGDKEFNSVVKHEIMTWKEFYELFRTELLGLTRSEVLDIVEYIQRGVYIVNEDMRYKFTAVQVFLLAFIKNAAENNYNNWNFSDKEQDVIRAVFEQNASNHAIGLNAVNQVIKVMNPFRTVMSRFLDDYGLTEEEKDDLEKAVTAVQTETDPAVRKQRVQDLTDMINALQVRLEAGDPRKAWSKGKRAYEKTKSLRYMFMLSSPITWIRNIVSNVNLRGLNYLSDRIGDTIFKATKKQYVRGQINLAGVEVSKDVLKFVKDEFVDNQLFESLYDTRTKFDERGRGVDKKGDIFLKQIKQAIESRYMATHRFDSKTLNKLSTLIMRAIGDRSFVKKAVNKYLGKMLQIGVNAGEINLANGFTDPEVLNAFAEAVILASEDYMHKRSFAADMLDSLRDKHPVVYEVISVFQPFLNSSFNWFGESLKFTPFGLITSIYKFAKLEHFIERQEDRRRQGYTVHGSKFVEYLIRRDIGKGVIGTIGFLFGVILGLTGVIKIDDDGQEMVIVSGNTKTKIDMIFGSSSILVGAALFGQIGEEKFEDIMVAACNALFEGFLLRDLLDRHKWDKGIWEGMLTETESVLKSFVPQFVQAVARYGAYKKIRYTPGIVGMLERFVNSFAPNALGDKLVNPYTGEEETKYALPIVGEILQSGLLGAKIYWVKPSAEEELAKEYGVRIQQLTGDITVDGTKIRLDNVLELNKYYGRLNKDSLSKIKIGRYSVKNSDGRFETISWSKMTDQQRANVIDREFSKNANYAKIYNWTQLMDKKYYCDTSMRNVLKELGITKNVYLGDKGFVR